MNCILEVTASQLTKHLATYLLTDFIKLRKWLSLGYYNPKFRSADSKTKHYTHDSVSIHQISILITYFLIYCLSLTFQVSTFCFPIENSECVCYFIFLARTCVIHRKNPNYTIFKLLCCDLQKSPQVLRHACPYVKYVIRVTYNSKFLWRHIKVCEKR
jgi:hypothetical protein